MSTVKQNWLEQNLPDGRKCWYNLTSGQTVWEEPTELSSPNPSITTSAPRTKGTPNWDIISSWREMTAASGRKYYYNTVTKVSMWEMPPEYAEYLENLKDPSQMDREKLEERFMAMLREKGITSQHTWEETLRQVINHPHYKLVPTLNERKALFARYQDRQREVEREEARQLAHQRSTNFQELLNQTLLISPTSRWEEVEAHFKSTQPAPYLALRDVNPEDMLHLFHEHVRKLQRNELEERKRRRRAGQEKLEKTLASRIDIFPFDLPWRRARDLMNDILRDDPDYMALDNLDKLVIFEQHVKAQERQKDELYHEQRVANKRKARNARTAFRKLLEEMECAGQLTATTSWRVFYTRIQHRPEFKALVEQVEGSTPLDLFWDHLHRLQEKFISEARPLFEELNGTWNPSNELNLQVWLTKVPPEKIPPLLKPLLYPIPPPPLPNEREEIRSRVDAFRKEHRRLIDRLKQCIKHWSNPIISIDTPYEAIASQLAIHSDGMTIPDDFIRRYYFDKYIRHLRKKAGLDNVDDKSEGED